MQLTEAAWLNILINNLLYIAKFFGQYYYKSIKVGEGTEWAYKQWYMELLKFCLCFQVSRLAFKI